MISSTAFSVIFLLVIVTKTSSMDLATTKKVLAKPLYDAPHADNQNSVPVSEKINPLLIFCCFRKTNKFTNIIAIFFSENNCVNILRKLVLGFCRLVQKSNRTKLVKISKICQLWFRAFRKIWRECTYTILIF